MQVLASPLMGDDQEVNKTLEIISSVLGWISFVCWSLSFYPQIWINYKAKSVAGFSLEFAILNPVGFYFYNIYTV